MGVNNFFINKITMTRMENGKRDILVYLDDEITDEVMDEIKRMLDSKELCRMALESLENDLSLCVFLEEEKFHVGIVDMYNDISFYYDNGSGKMNLRNIDGEVFEERMVGNDKDLLWNVIQEFAFRGNRCNKVKWIEE